MTLFMKSIILYSMNSLNSSQILKSPLVIVGLGKSGTSAKSFLIKLGYEKIFTFDEKADCDLKTWNDVENLAPGTLVVSPGVPLKSIHILKLKKMGWGITSELNLACSVLTDEIVIGITGSVGKSTVTSILGAGAKIQDKNAFVGGNLGVPFCDYAISILDKKPKAKYIILELSSYQLENCDNLKLEYSAITYLSANHLERYSTLDEYYLTKCQIGAKTKAVCILNSASKDLMAYKKNIAGTLLVTEITTQKINLFGKHNLENYFVAESIAKKCTWSDQSFLAMQNFSGLEHRLETVGEFNCVTYINDSKATAMDSVLVAASAALDSLNHTGTLHLMLGGKDKNLPWEQLSELSKILNIQIYFFGACAEVAKSKSNLAGTIYLKMSDALNVIFDVVQDNDIVLLSPGGTSLDEFKNFEDRGDTFKSLVIKNYSTK